MQCSFTTLGLLYLAVCLNWANSSSSVYNKRCNHSSECAVYPNITQGPDVIWIPLFCNEKNLCSCPNGWMPFVKEEICITQVSGSLTEETCTGSIWAISLLVIILLMLITYSCASLFSRRSPRNSQSINNNQHLPEFNSRTKI